MYTQLTWEKHFTSFWFFLKRIWNLYVLKVDLHIGRQFKPRVWCSVVSIVRLLFDILLIHWERPHCLWSAGKSLAMLGTYGFDARGGGLYCVSYMLWLWTSVFRYSSPHLITFLLQVGKGVDDLVRDCNLLYKSVLFV